MKTSIGRILDEEALYQLFSQLVAGWNQGNGRAFAASFTEDADYIVLNGSHLRGREAIATGHQQIFDTIFKGSKLVGAIKSIRFLSDDIALMHVQASPRIAGQPAPPPEVYSIQTLVAIRQPEGWRIAAFQNTLIQRER